MTSDSAGKSFLLEELMEDFDGEGDEEDNDSSSYELGVKKNKGFSIPISQTKAFDLYKISGTNEDQVYNDTAIFPSPSALTTSEENLIFFAKEKLNVSFDLDNFQVASLVALQQGRNVLL